MGDAEYFDFEALGGLKHLHDDITHFGASNPLTALRPKYLLLLIACFYYHFILKIY